MKIKRFGTVIKKKDLWVGVDLDGTIGKFHTWEGPTVMPPMNPVVKTIIQKILKKGFSVRIFTARATDFPPCIPYIKNWLRQNGLPTLEVTGTKDSYTVAIIDDIAVHYSSADTVVSLSSKLRPLLGAL